MIFHIHLRHAIVSRRQQKIVIKPNLARSGLKFAIPVRSIRSAQAEVPFADHCRFVAGFFEQARQRLRPRLDYRRAIGRRDAGARLAKGVLAREERKASRRARGGRAITAGKPNAALGQFVDMRRLQILRLRAVTAQIAITQIIGHDNDDVRFSCRL